MVRMRFRIVRQRRARRRRPRPDRQPPDYGTSPGRVAVPWMITFGTARHFAVCAVGSQGRCVQFVRCLGGEGHHRGDHQALAQAVHDVRPAAEQAPKTATARARRRAGGWC